jgi:hypothetical protein
MNRKTKIILVLLGSLFALCLCGFVALQQAGKAFRDQFITHDPGEIEAVAATMVDYDLPPDYQAVGASNFGLGKVLMLGVKSETTEAAFDPVITFMEVTSEGISDEARLQLEANLRRARNPGLKLVSTREITLRGQAVTLYTYEGTNAEGTVSRRVESSSFNGKEERIILIIKGTADHWNETEINNFIDSIH